MKKNNIEMSVGLLYYSANSNDVDLSLEKSKNCE